MMSNFFVEVKNPAALSSCSVGDIAVMVLNGYDQPDVWNSGEIVGAVAGDEIDGSGVRMVARSVKAINEAGGVAGLTEIVKFPFVSDALSIKTGAGAAVGADRGAAAGGGLIGWKRAYSPAPIAAARKTNTTGRYFLIFFSIVSVNLKVCPV